MGLKPDFRFDREDNGNCRVYFRRGALLYCFQQDGRGSDDEFTFYRCSRDGEPSYRSLPPGTLPAFEPETLTGKEFGLWLASRGAAPGQPSA